MAGYVMFRTPSKSCGGCIDQANAVRKTVRELATERGIKTPKRIGMSGAYFDYATISYTTNVMRELILEACKINKRKVLLIR